MILLRLSLALTSYKIIIRFNRFLQNKCFLFVWALDPDYLYFINLQTTSDPAVCMDARNGSLCVARQSGKLQFYRIPDGGLIRKVELVIN
jgi:hypothetical protein